MKHSIRLAVVTSAVVVALVVPRAGLSQQCPSTCSGDNTADGTGALTNNTTGFSNSAFGNDALYTNTTGPFNTAVGALALYYNLDAEFNTATGFQALHFNTGSSSCTAWGTPYGCCTGSKTGDCGNFNVAYGASALYTNYVGTGNSALGYSALSSNTGSYNTAVGDQAMGASGSGSYNVALGSGAGPGGSGSNNVAVGVGTGAAGDGSNNVGVGFQALGVSVGTSGNTAVGAGAYKSGTGSFNTAVGWNALPGAISGSYNIGLGWYAGLQLSGTSTYNIDIGHPGYSGDNYTIRIGNTNNNATYITGIWNKTSSGGVPVYVNSSHQLGTLPSSARFKDDIQDMGDSSSGLMKLRPVRFHYKKDIDPSRLEQYGLVAEEVAKVYPDLVTYDEEGRPEAVRYHFINAMLLNEVQKQARTVKAQAEQIEALTTQVHQASAQAEQIQALTARLVQLEATVSAQGHAPALEAAYKPQSDF